MTTETTKLGLTNGTYGELAGTWDQYWTQNNNRLEDRVAAQYAGDPNGNVAGYWEGQRCTDTTNNRQYICTATGVAASASWTELNTYLSTIGNINVLTAFTAPAIDDIFAAWDTSASGNRGITFSNYLKTINGLTAMAASDIDLSSDVLLLYDASASDVRKGNPNHLSGLNKLLQTVVGEYTTYLSMTASDTIPDDDTVPESNEGLQIISANITCSATTNYIEWEVSGNASNNSGSSRQIIIAIFGSASTALDSYRKAFATGDTTVMFMRGRTFATATTAITFAVNVGISGNGCYLNGNSSGRKLGGSLAWRMFLREVKP